MREFVVTLILFVVGYTSLHGQAYIQNTMYPYNRFVYNPAAAGTNESTTFSLMGRLQWVGIEGAPRLLTASLDGKIEDFGGLGGYVIQDELGPFSTTGLNLAYAYHLELGEIGNLNIGVNGGFLQKSLNAIWRYQDDIIDPVVGVANANYNQSVGVPNLGAGLYFYKPMESGRGHKYFLGISGQDLLEPSIDDLTLSPGAGTESSVPRSFYAMGGYTMSFSDDFSLMPAFLARTAGTSVQFDISAYATLKQTIVFGISHRWQDSFSGILGFDVSDRMFIGYSYDYTISDLNVQGDLSSHELIITYRFRAADGVGAKEVDVIRRNKP